MEHVEQQIIACEESLRQAMKEGNGNALDALLHPDLLFCGPTGQVVTKAMDISSYRSGNMQVERIDFSGRVINVFGDTAAVSVVADVSATYMGNFMAGKMRYIRVWKLFGDTWQLVAGSCMNIAR